MTDLLAFVWPWLTFAALALFVLALAYAATTPHRR